MLEYVLTGTVSALIGGFCTYAVIKYAVSDEKLLQKLTFLIDEVAQDDKTMQKLYIIGGVLGQGVAQGAGIKNLTGSRGGFKFKDIIGQFIGGFIQNKLGGSPQTEQEQPLNSGKKHNMSIE